MLKCLTFYALFCLGLVFVGCNPQADTGTVVGTVTLNGNPYTDAAVILFSPATGQGGSANIDADGRFTLPAPIPTGEYTVYLAPRIEETMPEDPKPVSIDQSVPTKYWDESSSDIVIQVNQGVNETEVRLESER